MTDPRGSHKIGCWYRNGGPECTCSRKRAVSDSGETKIRAVSARRGEDDDMLEKLKNFDPQGGLATEDAIALAKFARNQIEEYEKQGIEAPEYLAQKLADITRFLVEAQRSALLLELKKTEAQIEANRTAAERRSAAETKAAELRKKLGMTA